MIMNVKFFNVNTVMLLWSFLVNSAGLLITVIHSYLHFSSMALILAGFIHESFVFSD